MYAILTCKTMCCLEYKVAFPLNALSDHELYPSLIKTTISIILNLAVRYCQNDCFSLHIHVLRSFRLFWKYSVKYAATSVYGSLIFPFVIIFWSKYPFMKYIASWVCFLVSTPARQVFELFVFLYKIYINVIQDGLGYICMSLSNCKMLHLLNYSSNFQKDYFVDVMCF